MQVDFYQLTRDPAEKILPVIAQRVLDDHGRLLIVSDDRAQLEAISSALWTAKADSFLAHSMAGEGEDAFQPILLSDNVEALNAARFVVIADGNWRPIEKDLTAFFISFRRATRTTRARHGET